jgi:hypothetical protein
VTQPAALSPVAVRVWRRDDDPSSLLVKVVFGDGSAVTVLADAVTPAPVGEVSLWSWMATGNGDP